MEIKREETEDGNEGSKVVSSGYTGAEPAAASRSPIYPRSFRHGVHGECSGVTADTQRRSFPFYSKGGNALEARCCKFAALHRFTFVPRPSLRGVIQGYTGCVWHKVCSRFFVEGPSRKHSPRGILVFHRR